MNAIRQLRESTEGTALLAVLFFVVIIAMAASGMAVMLRGDMYVNRRMVDRIKAEEIADGAANQALATLANDPTKMFTLPSNIKAGSLSDGTYAVTTQALGSGMAVVIADGTVGDVTRTVKVYVAYPFMQAALQVAMFSNADIKLTGGGSCKENLGGGLHANGKVDISGNVEVLGDASAVETVNSSGASSVSGAMRPNSDWIEFPRLDFDYYYNIAQTNGEIYTGGKKGVDLKGVYSPKGGVMWIVGDVNIATHTTINGALFVTGDIHQAGQCVINQYKDFPAMASRDGDIHLSGHSDFMQGLIYAGSGVIDLTGWHRIKGSMVAWGNIFSRGNWGLVEYLEQDPELDDIKGIKLLAWEY